MCLENLVKSRYPDTENVYTGFISGILYSDPKYNATVLFKGNERKTLLGPALQQK